MAQKRLGDLLVESRLITERQLDRALLEQKETKERLGAVLVRLNYITTDKLLNFLSQRLNVQSVNLEKLRLDPAIVRIIPEKFARDHNLIAIQAKDKRLVVALGDPTNYDALDQITFVTGFKVITPVLAADTQITNALDKYYGQMFAGRNAPVSDTEFAVDVKSLEIISYGEDDQSRMPEKVLGKDEVTIDNLLQQLLADAAFRDATHIHIEPEQHQVHIRMRIDDKIYSYTHMEKRLERGLINKIKIISNIDTLVKKKPLDGFFQVKFGESKKVRSVAVSTFPSYLGERMVLNLRQTASIVPALDKIGIPESILPRYKSVINGSNGFVLITGPYHHGKTTTIYATLSAIASAGKIIFSYEESLRDQLDGVVQTVHVHQQDPVKDLRAIVKQNPDVLYLSDIHSPESYKLTMAASMGKILLLARYHSTDSFGALVSLLDLGISPYLVANSLNGILAQRLVRRLCQQCRQPDDKVPPRLVEHARSVLNIKEPSFYTAQGCDECKNTGYNGYIPVFEYLQIDKKISELIVAQKPITEIKNYALSHGMIPLQLDGLSKTAEGKTSYSEILSLR